MNETILIAIISASSALIGALIPTIINHLNNKRQNEFEIKKDLLNEQKIVYAEVMTSLQNVINTQKPDEFKLLQKAFIKLSIYGDNHSSKFMNEYYIALTKRGNTLTSEDHKDFQGKVLNSIRKNLGLEPLDSFELVAFRLD